MSDVSASLTVAPPSLSAWDGKDPEQTIAVLMSGGVDSSCTAMLLQDTGWKIVGFTMRIPRIACDHPAPCCGEEAPFVCTALDFPHYFLDTNQAFHDLVIEPFRQDYACGRTPSPCCDCNSTLKFGAVWDVIEQEFGLHTVATGHYVRVNDQEEQVRLQRAADLRRDQSYFLYGIPRARLPFLHFPLGGLTKDEVRALAEARNLHVAKRPDSMELCFAGEGDYRNALGDSVRDLGPGPVYDLQGNRLATHQGIWNYTVGQRKGLGFSTTGRRYVVRIEPAENALYIGTREEASRRDVTAGQLNILQPERCRTGARVTAKIRSLMPLEPCEIVELDEGRLTIRFDEEQFGPTPGQRMVLYDADECVIAGGVIE